MKNKLYFSNTPITEFSAKDASENDANLRNVEVFRVGEFHGGAVKFTIKDLREMVANFVYLKKEGILPNVPVRADHPNFMSGGSVDKIIGYIKDLHLKGEKMLADVKVTEPDAMEKIKRGTYVNRSAEIGTYIDNSGDQYDPTFFGFAFVDLPAVEGLSSDFVMDFSKHFDTDKFDMLNVEQFDGWNRKFINSLPDSSFAAIEPAYKKGDVTDKNARHLPFKNEDGSVDVTHLRNALARVNQVTPITDSISSKDLRKEALNKLNSYRHLLSEADKQDSKKDQEKNNALEEWDLKVKEIMEFNQFTSEDMKVKKQFSKEDEQVKPVDLSSDTKVEEGVNDGEAKETDTVVEAKSEVTETALSEDGKISETEGKPEEKAPEGVAKSDEPEVKATDGAETTEKFSKAKSEVMHQLSETQWNEYRANLAKLAQMETDSVLKEFTRQGKTTPGMKDAESKFYTLLTKEQRAAYVELKKVQPSLVKFDNDPVQDEQPEPIVGGNEGDKDADQASEEFLKNTDSEKDVLGEFQEDDEKSKEIE